MDGDKGRCHADSHQTCQLSHGHAPASVLCSVPCSLAYMLCSLLLASTVSSLQAATRSDFPSQHFHQDPQLSKTFKVPLYFRASKHFWFYIPASVLSVAVHMALMSLITRRTLLFAPPLQGWPSSLVLQTHLVRLPLAFAHVGGLSGILPSFSSLIPAPLTLQDPASGPIQPSCPLTPESLIHLFMFTCVEDLIMFWLVLYAVISSVSVSGYPQCWAPGGH